MTDDQSFCLQCGAAAVTPVSPPGKGPNVVVLASVGAVLALGLIAGVLTLTARKTPDTPVTATTSATVATTTATSTSTPEPTPSTQTPSESPTDEETPYRLPLSDFQGDWVPAENVPSDQVLHLQDASGGLLGSTDVYTLSLMTAKKGEEELEGTLATGEAQLEVRGDISRDMSELRLTVLKENGESTNWTFERPYTTMGPRATAEDYKRAIAFMPAPYTVRVLSARYPDDSSVVLTEKTGRIQKGIRLSELESANGEEAVYHYVEQNDGVHRIPDADPEQGVLWLPNDLEVGRKWNDGSYDCEVLAVDETVDLGFDKFPCLKVRRLNAAVEVAETAYYAVGYGEVLVQADGGYDALRLTSVTQLDEGQGANDILQKAPNVGKVPR